MRKIALDRKKLWQGCVLASIAHAISVARCPEICHEQSWDGFNYNVQDSSGSRGTITFHPHYLVCAFRNDNSERVLEYKNALEYFNDSPEEVKVLASNETLQYLLEDIDGETLPFITAAFWGNNEGIYSHDEIYQVIENGGSLIERQATDIETAINEWKEEYEMTDGQIILLKSIFQRKIKKLPKPLY
jgi:hypothetical protein